MEPPANLGEAHLRVVRPTYATDAVAKFYRDGSGFAVVSEFNHRNGFDGVVLGHAGSGYHHESTHQHGHEAGRGPSDDNLLVFSIRERYEWGRAVRRVDAQGDKPVVPFDPRRAEAGKAFDDPDGYRVVPRNPAWPA